MIQLKPTKNWIIIEWTDQALDKTFDRSGIVIQRKLERTRANWAKVIAIGPLVKNIKVGDFVLPMQTYKQYSEYPQEVEGGMISLTGDPRDPLVTYYKTKEEWCAFVSDDISVTYEINGENNLQLQEDVWADDFRLKISKKEK